LLLRSRIVAVAQSLGVLLILGLGAWVWLSGWLYDLAFKINDKQSHLSFQRVSECSPKVRVHRVGACKPVVEIEQDCSLDPREAHEAVKRMILLLLKPNPGKGVREFTLRSGARPVGFLPREVWVLFDQEQFAFPACEVGEEIPVTIPSIGREIQLKVWSTSPRLLVADNFLSEAECQHLISKSKETMKRSTVVTSGGAPADRKSQVRTSSSSWYKWAYDPVAHTLVTRVAELVGIAMNQESVVEYGGLQVLNYQNGEYYWAHLDAFPPKQLAGAKDPRNRYVTVFFYLTDVEEGGETGFPMAGPTGLKEMSKEGLSDCRSGVQVKPQRGRVAVFYNLHPVSQFENTRDERAWHLGCPVVSGEKWGANFWILLRGIGLPGSHAEAEGQGAEVRV